MLPNIKEIDKMDAAIEYEGKRQTSKNNSVIICAYGILSMSFMKDIGTRIETKYGTA